MKVIAQTGTTRFLMAEDGWQDDIRAEGVLVDLDMNKRWTKVPVHSLLARGYWEEPTSTVTVAALTKMGDPLVWGER